MASSPIVISRRQNQWARTIAQWYHGLGGWLYVVLVLAVITVMAFVYLYQASYVALQIDRMVALEERLDELHEQNSALLLRIAGYEDMSRIKNEARAMGLGEATHVEYVEVVVGGAAPRDGAVQESPTGSTYGTQPSSLPDDEALPRTGGSWVASTITQQFQSWIGTGMAAPGVD